MAPVSGAAGVRPDIVELIWRARERDHAEAPRSYLGASAVGGDCSRRLWLQFRHVATEKFPGRVLRLFETGHLEEARITRDLQAIGIEVEDLDPATGKQWAFSAYGGHVRGHSDGRVRGVPGFPADEWLLIEMKTHAAKSFAHLQAHGVYASKPQHYAQMQFYMHLGGMRNGVYVAKNKDNDDLHIEVVAYDSDDAQAIMERARDIVFGGDPPSRVSANPAVPPCAWCNFREHCHGGAPPAVSCRTCAHARPEQDGSWSCTAGQKYGRVCSRHVYHPQIVPLSEAERLHEDGSVEYRSKNGRRWINGPSGMSSEQVESQHPWSTEHATAPAPKRKPWQR